MNYEYNTAHMSEIIVTQEPPIRGTIRKVRIMGQLLNFAVYVLIVTGIVFGLPKFLVWKLNTIYPMAAITSGSMWPALKKGDLVFIEGVARENIALGDIIVFQNRVNGTLTIHRVVELNDDTVITKGDANFGEDMPVSYPDIIGRTYDVLDKPLRIPLLGSVTMFASDIRKKYENP